MLGRGRYQIQKLIAERMSTRRTRSVGGFLRCRDYRFAFITLALFILDDRCGGYEITVRVNGHFDLSVLNDVGNWGERLSHCVGHTCEGGMAVICLDGFLH